MNKPLICLLSGIITISLTGGANAQFDTHGTSTSEDLIVITSEDLKEYKDNLKKYQERVSKLKERFKKRVGTVPEELKDLRKYINKQYKAVEDRDPVYQTEWDKYRSYIKPTYRNLKTVYGCAKENPSLLKKCMSAAGF